MDSIINCISSLYTTLYNKLIHKENKRIKNNNGKPRNNSTVSTSDDTLLLKLRSRFNYAGSSCSARVISTNSGAQSVSSILSSSKDAYLRNLCSNRGKFVVVELCEEVKVDTLVLANYELFSSTFKSFKAFGAPKSGNSWSLLLKGAMRDGKALHADQAFPVSRVDRFIKYLKIELDDSHYGNEHFCPVSSLRVYGKTMLDELEDEVSSDHNNGSNTLPVIFQKPDPIAASDPQLKGLMDQMTRLSSEIAHLQLRADFFNYPKNPFLLTCSARFDGDLVRLKDRYMSLEGKYFALNSSKKRHGGNVFKVINERLNTLEGALQSQGSPFKFFNVLKHASPHLILDSQHQQQQRQEDTFESLADLIAEISGLKYNLKRTNSALIGLFIFNLSFVLIGIIYLFFFKGKNNRKSDARSSRSSPELLRRPLMQLKSPSSGSLQGSISSNPLILSHSRNNSITSAPLNTSSGILLSDDEVLLFDGGLK